VLIDLPDFANPLRSIARSAERIAALQMREMPRSQAGRCFGQASLLPIKTLVLSDH